MKLFRGSMRSDGSWTGMIGELHTKKADIGKIYKMKFF